MARIKICPVCGAKTKGTLFSAAAVDVTNMSGEILRDPFGRPRRGVPRSKCRKCDWFGDILLLAPSPPPRLASPPKTYTNDDDDYDEDYINHYYH